VAELDLNKGKVVKNLDLLPPNEPTSPSSHPAAFAWGPGEKTLYVALANRDAVAAVRVGGDELKLETIFDTRLPGQTYFGAMRMRSPYRRTADGSLPPTPVPMRLRSSP